MNYGKSAYLKVLELERRLLGYGEAEKGFSSFLDLSKPNINQDFDSISEVTVEFPPFLAQSESICFQIIPSFKFPSAGKVKLQIIVNDIIISEQEKPIPEGESEVVLIKTYEATIKNSVSVKLRITGLDGSGGTLCSVDFVVLGASGNGATNEFEFRAIRIGDEALISFIQDGKLFYKQVTIEEKQLSPSDFTYYGEAISHCFCLSSFEDGPEVYLYRVDKERNLYHSTFQKSGERKIASGVDKVFACTCPSGLDDINLVVFIKNKECYYKTIREGGEVVERKLPFPKGEYDSIYAVSHPECDIVYVLARASDSSNYIACSLIEVSTGKIIETLKGTYSLSTKKYIDMGAFKNKLIESLNIGFKLQAKSFINSDDLFERIGVSHLDLKLKLDIGKYEVSSK